MTQADPEYPSTEIFCSICQKFNTISPFQSKLNSTSSMRKAIYLHGSPLHAMIIFRNASGQIIAHEIAESIQLVRDARVISQLIGNFHCQKNL